jgi:hypothetical protein
MSSRCASCRYVFGIIPISTNRGWLAGGICRKLQCAHLQVDLRAGIVCTCESELYLTLFEMGRGGRIKVCLNEEMKNQKSLILDSKQHSRYLKEIPAQACYELRHLTSLKIAHQRDLVELPHSICTVTSRLLK